MQSLFTEILKRLSTPILWVLFSALLLSGCASPSLEDYADRTPELVPEEFFTGELSARGVVKNFSGEVIRTFDADISASWDDEGVGTLDEVFRRALTETPPSS